MSVKEWTDEELNLVYDLQKGYAEKVVEFVRHGEEEEVKKFLELIPELHDYGEDELTSKGIYLSAEMERKSDEHGILDNKYIYKDMFNKWQSADTLREIFEEKYQVEFEISRPEEIALFAGNQELALEKYTESEYEEIRKEIPKKLKNEVEKMIKSYPENIQEKAMEESVYGCTNIISKQSLNLHRIKNMPEFERIQEVTKQEKGDTIVKAYDLQKGLEMYQPTLSGRAMREALKYYQYDAEIFEMVYGRKATELLKAADENTIRLAKRYDFVNTEEKLPVLENHKICLYGTAGQKMRISYKDDPFCVSDEDYKKIIETIAESCEKEGFSRTYQPNKKGAKEYEKQAYKVIGRYQSKEDVEEQPKWNIVFEDGKIITAKADEIIPTKINERIYGEKGKKLPTRPFSEAKITLNEKLSLSEGSERISAIISQLQKNGENINKIREILERERKTLTKECAR